MMRGIAEKSTGEVKIDSLSNGNEPSASRVVSEDPELALALRSYVPDTPEEKRLVRKIDMILLPCLWWMYILAYLDKGNIVSCVKMFQVLLR